MLYSLFKALLGDSKKEVNVRKTGKEKLTQKEKDELEYNLWVMAEEYKEE